MDLLTRLSTALLSLPLLICRPVLRMSSKRDHRSRARQARIDACASAQTRTTSVPAAAISSSGLLAMREALRRELVARAVEGSAFPHLARFERKFSKIGLRAIDDVPVEQLRRALAEFEAMVRNWSSPALADLRSRMAVRLADRASASTMWLAANSVAPA